MGNYCSHSVWQQQVAATQLFKNMAEKSCQILDILLLLAIILMSQINSKGNTFISFSFLVSWDLLPQSQ